MKTRQITIPHYAENTTYLFTENVTNSRFEKMYLDIVLDLIDQGFMQLNKALTLRGRNATEKVIIKARYWNGACADVTTKTHSVFYK